MSSTTIPTVGYDQHHEESRQAQRQADRWLITGTLLMGSMFIGFVGLPFFLRGVWLQRRAQKAGLSVRPIIVTLIGYLVILDAALNSSKTPTVEASEYKLYATELSRRIADATMDIVGPGAQLALGTEDAPLRGRAESCYTYTVIDTIGGGSSEVQRNIIAKRKLDLPKNF